MRKFKNLQDYLNNNGSPVTTREELKEMILHSALNLLGDCAHNFDGDAEMTEQTSQPLFILNELIDSVE